MSIVLYGLSKVESLRLHSRKASSKGVGQKFHRQEKIVLFQFLHRLAMMRHE